MTATRDPDRLLRAWLDLMPDEAPDRIIATVLQATSTAPQARALPRIGRWRFPMNRLVLISASALVLAALAGGSVLIGAWMNQPPPSPSPTLGLGAAPAFMRSATWVTDATVDMDGETFGPRLRMDVSADGEILAIRPFADRPPLLSRVMASAPGELNLVSSVAGRGCAEGDAGRYSVENVVEDEPLSDAVTFAVRAISEDCDSRRAAFSRHWVRSIDAVSRGGRGAIVPFVNDAVYFLTLPPGSYTTHSGPDAATIFDAALGRELHVVRNPWGYTEPCSGEGGDRLPVQSTADAFVAYLETLPGFTVQTTELTKDEPGFDGPVGMFDRLPSLQVTIPSVVTEDCPSGRVYEWSTSTAEPGGRWHLAQGDTDILYLVERGSDLYLIQWLGDGVTRGEEQALFSTSHWRDRLPIPGP